MRLLTITTLTLLLMPIASIHAELLFNDGGYYLVDYTTTDAVWVDRANVELVEGGWLNQKRSIYVYNQGRFTMSGGKMDWSIWASDDGEVTVTGGDISGYLNSSSTKSALVSGGSMNAVSISQHAHLDFEEGIVNSHISLLDGASAIISGGKIGGGMPAAAIRLFQDATATISGGEIINGIQSGWYSTDAAIITLVGSNFKINGESVSGGAKASSFARSGTIIGVLENGDVFDNSYELNGASDIQIIPEPSTAILLGGTGILFFCLRRKLFR